MLIKEEGVWDRQKVNDVICGRPLNSPDAYNIVLHPLDDKKAILKDLKDLVKELYPKFYNNYLLEKDKIMIIGHSVYFWT